MTSLVGTRIGGLARPTRSTRFAGAFADAHTTLRSYGAAFRVDDAEVRTGGDQTTALLLGRG